MRINTLEQLDGLPVGSIIKAAFPAGAMEKFQHGVGTAWMAVGSHVMYQAAIVPLPAELLWKP